MFINCYIFFCFFVLQNNNSKLYIYTNVINHKKMEKTTLLISLSKAQKRQIEILAKAQGLSTSEYLRRKGLNK